MRDATVRLDDFPFERFDRLLTQAVQKRFWNENVGVETDFRVVEIKGRLAETVEPVAERRFVRRALLRTFERLFRTNRRDGAVGFER